MPTDTKAEESGLTGIFAGIDVLNESVQQRAARLTDLLTQLHRQRKTKTGNKDNPVNFRMNPADKELLDLLAESFGLGQGDQVSLMLSLYAPHLIRLKEQVDKARAEKILSVLERALGAPSSSPAAQETHLE